MVFTVCLFASTAHSAQRPKCMGKFEELIMRFRIELIPDSTVYSISDWFHVPFRAFPKTRKRYKAYRTGSFSCKQDANPNQIKSNQIINILYSWCNVVRKKLINTNYLQYNLQVCLRNIYKLHNVMGRLFTNFAITCFTRPGFDLSFKACNCW